MNEIQSSFDFVPSNTTNRTNTYPITQEYHNSTQGWFLSRIKLYFVTIFFQEGFILTMSVTWPQTVRSVLMVHSCHMTKHQERELRIAELVH